MEKIKKYEKIIVGYFKAYAERRNNNPYPYPPTKLYVIADTERKHYQLIDMGWDDNRQHHVCLFHVDIIDDKVWIQRNVTETLIAQDFVGLGIPKHDIVLGVIHPKRRKDTEYAVA